MSSFDYGIIHSRPRICLSFFLSFPSEIVAPWLWRVYCWCVFSMGVIPSSYSSALAAAAGSSCCPHCAAPQSVQQWSPHLTHHPSDHSSQCSDLTTQTSETLRLSSPVLRAPGKAESSLIQSRPSKLTVWTGVWSHCRSRLSVALA